MVDSEEPRLDVSDEGSPIVGKVEGVEVYRETPAPNYITMRQAYRSQQQQERKEAESRRRERLRFSSDDGRIALRLSEWPTDGVPSVGRLVPEYLTRKDLIARGWTEALIRDHLGHPDGIRKLDGRRVKHYFSRNRVEEAELDGLVAVSLRSREPRRPEEPSQLALTDHQLRTRGWTDGLIRRFLSQPDATRPGRQQGCTESLYLASRIEEVERSQDFLERWNRIRRPRDEGVPVLLRRP